MDDKNFDQHLKSVLDNLEPAYDAASWNALEARMNAAFVEEQPVAVDAVDKAVFHTLDRMEAPYQAAHWQLLTARMQMQATRLLRLRLAKLAEFALLMAFLWNFPGFINVNSTTVPKKPLPNPNVPIAQAGNSGTNDAGIAGRQVFSEDELSQKRAAAINSRLQRLLSDPTIPFVVSMDYRTAPSIVSILNGHKELLEKVPVPIASLLPTDALSPFDVPDRLLNMPIVPTKNVNKPGPFYLAASANLDQNSILINGTRRNSPGYGLGLAAGYRAGKWGLEAGLGYVNKQYVPKRKVEIYAGNLAEGYYGSSLTEVHVEMVAVPVKVSRQIAHFGKTSAHVTAGMTANFVAQKTFDYGTVYYAPDVLPPNFLPDPSQAPQLRQEGRGVLEKGGLKDNFYASLDAGIRIEHPIAGRRYTAFVEPTFRKSLSSKGVGPKREPINTFSIQAGVVAFL